MEKTPRHIPDQGLNALLTNLCLINHELLQRHVLHLAHSIKQVMQTVVINLVSSKIQFLQPYQMVLYNCGHKLIKCLLIQVIVAQIQLILNVLLNLLSAILRSKLLLMVTSINCVIQLLCVHLLNFI